MLVTKDCCGEAWWLSALTCYVLGAVRRGAALGAGRCRQTLPLMSARSQLAASTDSSSLAATVPLTAERLLSGCWSLMDVVCSC